MPAFSVPLNQFDITQAILKQPTSHAPANLPVPNPTKSFWIDSVTDANPLAKEGSTGSLTEEADLCIIGSGITGMRLGLHFAICATDSARGPYQALVLHTTYRRLLLMENSVKQSNLKVLYWMPEISVSPCCNLS
jgi:hypothetical protein